ncbi:hypothetical protein PHLGIDRAFT_16251 [Phlebiopsis gigantea 11061_1 CR5-6]|uniref:PPPDE domain-containing protein n=1 Tax=Phlebiopsis gigantea (strain 11061_1 CR5-6) TaxID=745531 RepID=A0A0C3RRT3_PHLG1|nr:hypothetical protein PHLGIDRAFT_16251 [Phlebiopsis gigantea 11061_1 CR5-6]
MGHRVQVYVYDESHGLSRRISRILTGRQFDGVWHTNVVVYGRELGYGYGIIFQQPSAVYEQELIDVIDMGETSVDEAVFIEFLGQLAARFGVDNYHLTVDWNCNHFTDECVFFLTGRNLPPWIRDFSTEVLSTRLGYFLRPVCAALFWKPRLVFAVLEWQSYLKLWVWYWWSRMLLCPT